MKEYEIVLFHNINKDLFLWIKRYLANKLLHLKRDKLEKGINIEKYAKDILECENIDCLSQIEKVLLKNGMRSYYTYSPVMVHLYKFIDAQHLYSIKDITNILIYEEFIHKYFKDKSANTQKRFYMTTLNFFKYIDEHNIDKDNLLQYPYVFNFTQDNRDKVKKTQIDNEHTTLSYLNTEELSLFNTKLSLLSSSRERLMIMILLYSGITASELINIKRDDIEYFSNKEDQNRDTLVLHIEGEAEKKRDIPLPFNNISKTLQEYRDNYRKSEYLFYIDNNSQYKQLTTQSILSITKKAFEEIGIEKEKISTAIFRNSFAIFLKNKRYTDKQIQILMGHHDTITTQNITKYANEDLFRCSDEFEGL